MHGVMAHMNVAPLPAIERALLAKGYACVRFDFNAQVLPIEEESAKYTGPVCIIQGTADKIVPKEDVDAYVPVFRNRVYITVEGANHIYSWHLGDVLSSVFIFLLAVGNSS